MGREILQPTHIERPDYKNEVIWASLSVIHEQWLRHVLPQLGLDSHAYVLGDVLDTMVGDDANSFGIFEMYIPEVVPLEQAYIDIRLAWEASIPEFPQYMHNRIVRVRHLLKEMDWSGEENFIRARSLWTTYIEEYTTQQIEKNTGLNIAFKYYEKNRDRVSPYWREFLR